MTTGHNSGAVAGEQLRAFVERQEKVQAEIDDLNADKSEIFAEAKGYGYDVKIIKEILKIRRKDPAAQAEFDAVLDLYKNALDMS